MKRLPKIYECLNNNDIRPAMNYALVQKDETAATNAHILVVHASSELFDAEFLETLPDDGILLGKKALKDLTKADVHSVKFHPDMKIIEVLHLPHGVGVFSYKRYYEVKLNKDLTTVYPNYKAVFPSKEKKLEPVSKIGVNPALLSKLQKAMGADTGVRFEFYGEAHSIICYPLESDYSFCKGLIMPVMSPQL